MQRRHPAAYRRLLAISLVLAPAQHLGESGYSRGREAAADAKALAILQCHYGHAGGATELFTTLQREEGKTPAVLHYLASHPSMAARIDAVQVAMRQAGLQAGPVQPLPRF